MSAPILRAKMKVQEVTHIMNDKGEIEQERVKLSAVYGQPGTENAEWSRWTPYAEFTIGINNPKAFNTLSKGHEFYVDFTPVDR